MTDNPSFSVLMSLYKKENPAFLRESLESILKNTMLPSEIVLVEDGPLTEELENVLKEYQGKTGLFRCVVHPQNQGLGIALRDGVLACKNEIIARMDTDDICHPQRFARQLQFLKENQNIAVVGSNVEEFSRDYQHPDQYVEYPKSDEAIVTFARRRNPMRHPSVMFRKSAVLTSGNYRHFLWFEDYDLYIRMLLAGFQMANIQDVLLYCRADNGLFERRGGIKYLCQDIRFQQFMLRNHFIGAGEFVFNCIVRALVRLLPNGLRRWFYRTFFRTRRERIP
ncbi:MAG: glycosyltransferase [Lachnospiraceae bacterium]|nr:glycosyltransferase [Lachnospiraceae bacterium]